MKKFRKRMLSNGLAMALVISSLATIPAAAASNTDFKDIKSHWAENEIKSFLQKGYINGYGDNTFKPDNSITRAEFIKIVNMAFGFSEKGSENFKDVNPGDWFYDEVLKAMKQGYIDGYGDNTFRPNDKISREEACKIVGVILKSDGYGDTKFKDDNQIESWAKKYVKGLVDMGIIKGFEDNTFRPKSNTSRAETVTVVKGSIEYQSPGNGGGTGSQVNLNPVVTTQQQVNELSKSTQYTSITINASEEIKLTGIKATTMNINSGDVTLEDCTIDTLNIGGTTRTRAVLAIKVNAIGSTKLYSVNINSATEIDIAKGISVSNLVVGQNAGGTQIKGDGEILKGEINSNITSEIEFDKSGEGKVELIVVVTDLNVSTNGNDVTVTAIAKNYEPGKAKVELIGEGEQKTTEVEIGNNGEIAHTFEGVANGKYTAKVTVESVSISSEEFDVFVEQVDKLSEYGFEFTMNDKVIEDTEYNADMGLKATTVNQLGYTNALVKVSVTTPQGGTVQLLATDTNNKEWDIAQIGQWGPSQGFEVANDYNATTPVKVRFSTAGDYTIKLTLVDVANKNEVITSEDIHVNVVANIPDTVLTKSSELVDGKVSFDWSSTNGIGSGTPYETFERYDYFTDGSYLRFKVTKDNDNTALTFDSVFENMTLTTDADEDGALVDTIKGTSGRQLEDWTGIQTNYYTKLNRTENDNYVFYGVRQTGKTEGTTRTVGLKAGDSRKIDMVLTPKAGVDAGTYTITVETLQQGSSDVKGTIVYTMVVE